TSAEFLQGANLLTAIYSGNSVYAGSSATTTVANPLADFTMIPATTLVNVPSSGSTTDVIQLASVNGFAGALKLGCTASSGIICSLSAASPTLSSGGNTAVTLTVDASNVTTAGTYNVMLTGADSTGLYVHTLGLQVLAPASTVAPGFSVTPSPTSVTVAPGNTATDTLTVSPTGGFTGAVALSCAVTGAGANPPTCSAPGVNVTLATAATSPLTIATSANTAPGSYPANITTTSGAVTPTATVGITVSTTPPGFSLTPSPTSLTLAAGATSGNTSTITVTPTSGFTGGVSFTCAVTTAPASANDSP